MNGEPLDPMPAFDDFVGIAAAGAHDMGDYVDIARDFGVDTNKCFPVGISVFGSILSVSFLVVRKETYGETAAGILERARADGNLAVIQIGTDWTLADVAKRFKETEIVFKTRLLREAERHGVEARVVEHVR